MGLTSGIEAGKVRGSRTGTAGRKANVMAHLELLRKLNGFKLSTNYYLASGHYILKMDNGLWRTRKSGPIDPESLAYHKSLSAALRYVDGKGN